MKVTTKLLIGFALNAVLILILSTISNSSLIQLKDNVNDLANDKYQKVACINDIKSDIFIKSVSIHNAILSNDSTKIVKLNNELSILTNKITANLDSLKKYISNKEAIILLDKVNIERAKYLASSEQVIETAKIDHNLAINQLSGDNTNIQNDFINAINELLQYQRGLFKEGITKAEATYDSVSTILLLLAIVSILLVFVFAFIISRTITKPLKKAVLAADAISNGILDVDLSSNTNDETGHLLNSMQGMVNTLINLTKEFEQITEATTLGRLDARANESAFKGEYKTIVCGLNNTLDAVIGPLNVTAEYIDRISQGDIPPKITEKYNGDFNIITNNLNQCIDAIGLLIYDMMLLSEAYSDGNLDYRIDVLHHKGDYKKIMAGINKVLDEVVIPLKAISGYFGRIANGDIPSIINDEYKGDFHEIKLIINKGITAINLLIDDIEEIAQANKSGILDRRIDLNKHFGDFRRIIEGVNSALDAVIEPLKLNTEIFEQISKGDIPIKSNEVYLGYFETLRLIVNQCIDAINLLVEDTSLLSQAASEGNLGTRADTARHGGDFRKIVEGVNKTLDVIVSPVEEISSVMSIFSTGDISARIVSNYNGDFAELKEDINDFADNLSTLITQITSSVQNTANAASNISNSAETLAAASQEQSTQADDVAHSVAAMTRTIMDNAMSASRTAEVATHNSMIASESGKVVKQTVEKMKDIAVVVKNSAKSIEQLGESSKEIGEIISVIDNIADQTNLLALNAAIEAARAGDQGRGFAVVADEVRKLAERTTEATKQIATMIKGIQNETEQAVVAMNQGTKEVQTGIELADKAGDSLNQILNSTQEVLDMVNQIASASEEQSATSEQISKNVLTISQVTTESARNVEEVARIADELTQVTEQLRDLVLTFKVSNQLDYSHTSKFLGNNRTMQLNPASYGKY